MDERERVKLSRRYWDEQAKIFDCAADHGLHDPRVYAAWEDLLDAWLPRPPAVLLDIGCGTGSLSVLLGTLGYDVTGIDLSPAMIDRAVVKARAAGQTIDFQVGDAFDPQLEPDGYDVIVCRHLLWALPDPALALRRWAGILSPGGRLLLIEGFWETGGGLHAQEVVQALAPGLTPVAVKDLSGQPDLWGGPVTDERYLIVADFQA